MNRVIKFGCIVLVLFLFVSQTAFAATCSDKVRASAAKAIANRDKAYVQLQIASSSEQIEKTYQDQLTATLEAKYAISLPATSYVLSIRPTISAELQKELEKARKTRTRDKERALKSRGRAVESAQKRFDSAYKRTPVLNCTL